VRPTNQAAWSFCTPAVRCAVVYIRPNFEGALRQAARAVKEWP
jgi:hypothetical protein